MAVVRDVALKDFTFGFAKTIKPADIVAISHSGRLVAVALGAASISAGTSMIDVLLYSGLVGSDLAVQHCPLSEVINTLRSTIGMLVEAPERSIAVFDEHSRDVFRLKALLADVTSAHLALSLGS